MSKEEKEINRRSGIALWSFINDLFVWAYEEPNRVRSFVKWATDSKNPTKKVLDSVKTDMVSVINVANASLKELDNMEPEKEKSGE